PRRGRPCRWCRFPWPHGRRARSSRGWTSITETVRVQFFREGTDRIHRAWSGLGDRQWDRFESVVAYRRHGADRRRVAQCGFLLPDGRVLVVVDQDDLGFAIGYLFPGGVEPPLVLVGENVLATGLLDNFAE